MKDIKNTVGDVIFARNSREMFGFSLFGRSNGELLNVIQSDIAKKKKIWIATVNPEFVMETRRDNKFLEILQKRTSYNVIDGVGLIWALKTKDFFAGLIVGFEILMGSHRESLITGADLIDDLCALAEKNELTVYFYGGWDDRSRKTADYFLEKYPKLKILGAQAENFDFKTEVDFLFVCRAMKKQEEWIDQNLDRLNCKLVIGLGRTFDYYSGELSRAPRWMQNMGLEWLYSLITDGSRRKRKLELLKFAQEFYFGNKFKSKSIGN